MLGSTDFSIKNGLNKSGDILCAEGSHRNGKVKIRIFADRGYSREMGKGMASRILGIREVRGNMNMPIRK